MFSRACSGQCSTIRFVIKTKKSSRDIDIGRSTRMWEIRMNEARPYMYMWREVRVCFVKLSWLAFYPSDIDLTVYIARWQAYHHQFSISVDIDR